jgi:DNA-binding transcriptional LysR family regulator
MGNKMNQPLKTRQHKGYRRIIPSMNALVAFEAVARNGSFTIAAQELGVTQAAVSKHVKFLEDTFGAQLFYRLHRSNQLTTEGNALYDAMSESMQRIAGVFDKYAEGQGEEAIALASTADFSNLRIMPRLHHLREQLPKLRLRLTTPSDRDADLSVRFGHGKWDDGTAVFLFDEEIFPVCSPSWLARHCPPTSLDELAHNQLIDTDATLEGWMTWNTWFRALAYTPPKLEFSLRCAMYGDAILAAVQGHGIALGWGRLLENHLASGRLVRVSSHAIVPSDAYYIFLAAGRPKTPVIDKLMDCLRADDIEPCQSSL